MRKTCIDCKARFEIDFDDLDEGEYINCPECNLEYTVVPDEADPIKFTIIESKKLEMDKEADEMELADDEDYDFD